MAKVLQKCKEDPRSAFYPCEKKRCGHPWTVRYRESGGRGAKQREKTFPRWSDANQYSVKVENDKFSGVYLNPELGRISVEEYAWSWLKSVDTLQGRVD